MSLIGGNLIVYLSADTRKFERGMSKATSLTDTFKKSATIAAGVLLRDLGRSLVSGAQEAIRMGAKMETLQRSFDRMSASVGGNVSSLQELKKATKGMVADVDLLTSANQAMALGLPTENLDALFDSAIRLGKAMGIDAKTAVDSLTIGIGRQSRLVLDNLGVIVKAEDAYNEYAKSLGTTADKLTEAERKQAFMTVAIEKVTEKAEILGDNIGENEKQLERWSAALKNATSSLGALLQPLSGLVPVLQILGPTIGVVAATSLPSLGFATLGYIALAGVLLTSLVVLIGAFRRWVQETNPVIQAQKRVEGAVADLNFAVREAADASEAYNVLLEQEGVALEVREAALKQQVSANEHYEASLQKLVEAEEDLVNAEDRAASVLSFLRGETEDYILSTDKLTWSSEQAQIIYVELNDELAILQSQYDKTAMAAATFNDEIGINNQEMKRNRLEIDKIRDAIEDRKDGTIETINALEEQIEAEKKNVDSNKRLSDSSKARIATLEKLKSEVEDTLTPTEEEAKRLRELDSANRDLRISNQEISLELDNVTEKLEEQTKTIEEQTEKVDLLTEADDALEEAHSNVAEQAESVEEAHEDLEKATEKLGEALIELITTQDAVAQAHIDAAREARDQESAENDLAAAIAARAAVEAEEEERRRQEEEPIVPGFPAPEEEMSFTPSAISPTGGLPSGTPNINVSFTIQGEFTRETYNRIRPELQKDLRSVLIESTSTGSSTDKIILRRG